LLTSRRAPSSLEIFSKELVEEAQNLERYLQDGVGETV